MPIVEFEEREIRCEEGAVLRDVLLSAGESPHNGPTDALNVEGPTSDHTDLEQWRLSLPPHRGNDGLRLACQTRVHGDVDVEKHEGFWGQHVDGDTDGGGDGGAGESAASADGDQ
jgi:hypothetical protein